MQYYHKYVAIEGGEADARGRSHACLGLARCCEKQGDPQAAKSYLAELVDLSVQLSELRVAAESCSRLGKIVTVEVSSLGNWMLKEKEKRCLSFKNALLCPV